MAEREEVFVDANIFLEVFLRDCHAERCRNFLRTLTGNGYDAVTSDFIVYTCILQVENKHKSATALKDFLIAMSNFNIEVVRPVFNDAHEAVQIAEKTNLDFDDALIVSCMKGNGI